MSLNPQPFVFNHPGYVTEFKSLQNTLMICVWGCAFVYLSKQANGISRQVAEGHIAV